MEEKKTTRTRKTENGHLWISYLLDGIFGSIQSFVSGAVESIEEAVQAIASRLAKQAFIVFLAFLGIAFLLVGLSRLFSAILQMPGAGEALMGIVILLLSLVLYMFTRK